MAGHVAQIFDVSPGHITAIPNGIDPADLVAASGVELVSLRARYRAPDERLVLLVGRLGVREGLSTWRSTRSRRSQATAGCGFVVAGTGTAEGPSSRRRRDALGLSELRIRSSAGR